LLIVFKKKLEKKNINFKNFTNKKIFLDF